MVMWHWHSPFPGLVNMSHVSTGSWPLS